MTSTPTDLLALRQQMPHLKDVTDEGWVLSWEASNQPGFEIVCKKANASQIQALDATLSQAYQRAQEKFLN